MSIKKKIGQALIFISVFTGTIIGAGISFITASAPGKRPGDRVNNAIQKIKKDAGDHIQTTTVKLIEKSARLENRVKTEVEDIKSIVESATKSFKDSFDAGKAKMRK